MKKAIAILLVLLVAGVAFGADTGFDTVQGSSTAITLPTTPAELTLQANTPGKFVHGFSSVDLTNFGQIVNYVFAEDQVRTVDFEVSTAQQLAYYVIATNTRNDFRVKLTANPLKSEEYISETGTYFYVPYDLSIDGEAAVTVGGTSAGTSSTTVATEYLFGGESAYSYLSSNTNGILVDSIPLTLTWKENYVTGESGAEGVGLPEGNYTATIQVAIETN